MSLVKEKVEKKVDQQKQMENQNDVYLIASNKTWSKEPRAALQGRYLQAYCGTCGWWRQHTGQPSKVGIHWMPCLNFGWCKSCPAASLPRFRAGQLHVSELNLGRQAHTPLKVLVSPQKLPLPPLAVPYLALGIPRSTHASSTHPPPVSPFHYATSSRLPEIDCFPGLSCHHGSPHC